MDFYDLNEVNELVELGFIQSKPGNRIALHPMMQEVAVSDLPPSITSCHTMLESIRATCRHHGLLLPYHQLMFQTIKNAIDLAAKDDAAYYLLLLQDVFPYMENYRYMDGLRRLIAEMETVMDDHGMDMPKNRALLLQFRAMIETNIPNAAALLEEAAAFFSEITPDNAHLASNLHGNLGSMYRAMGQIEIARRHMQTAILLLEQYGLIGNHDSLVQYMNYAMLLYDSGEPKRALDGLQKWEPIFRALGEDGADFAMYLQIMGGIYLKLGEVQRGEQYLMQAIALYQDIWGDQPEELTKKKFEFVLFYAKAGLSVGKWLIEA